MQELLGELPLPTFQQFMFVQVALFTALMALLVVVAKNLFHSALSLVGTLFGVAGIYVLLEAEFLAVSQILVYVGGISTLITFAIMLTRSMMFGDTAPVNRQAGTAAIIIGTLFSVLAGLLAVIPWPGPAEALQPAIPISDVASIVSGEKSVQFIIADTESSAAETALADAKAALESAKDAEITKAEKALAEAEVIQTEAKGNLDIVIAKAAVAAAGTVLADAEAAFEAATVADDRAEAEKVVAEAQAALVEKKASLAETEDKLAEALAELEEADAEEAEAEEADAEEADVAEAEEADTEEADVAEAEEADTEEADVAEAEAEADAEEADTEEADVAAADTSAEETAISADILAAAPAPALVERNGKSDGEVLIAGLGQLFVTTYLVPFELMALLLLVVLAGAIMLARDRA